MAVAAMSEPPPTLPADRASAALDLPDDVWEYISDLVGFRALSHVCSRLWQLLRWGLLDGGRCSLLGLGPPLFAPPALPILQSPSGCIWEAGCVLRRCRPHPWAQTRHCCRRKPQMANLRQSPTLDPAGTS